MSSLAPRHECKHVGLTPWLESGAVAARLAAHRVPPAATAAPSGCAPCPSTSSDFSNSLHSGSFPGFRPQGCSKLVVQSPCTSQT